MRSIILKKNIFSEGNEIITIFTRDLGKIRVVARSIKSPKSKLSFGLQSLFYTDVDFLTGSKLPIITGVKPISVFKNIYGDSEKINLALYGAEILLKSTADEQPNPALFDLFLSFLEHLNVEGASNHLCGSFFALRALAANGYALSFESCAVCGKALASDSAEEQINFSNRRNGFVCLSCLEKVSDSTTVEPGLYQVLRRNQGSSFDQVDRENIDASQLHRLVRPFLEHILERNLNSAGYLGKM